MKSIFIILTLAALAGAGCVDRNRVGKKGSTGDGGVESTATRLGDTIAHKDTAVRHNH